MKILVTGGLGFIGSHLVDELLLDPKNEITVMDNLCSESSSRLNMRDSVRYWIDDVRNICTLKYSNEKFDVIYHLAALARIQPSFGDPLTYLSIDIMGTSAVLEYARQIGETRVVYAGSSSAYAGPMLNPYAFAKYTGEQVCELYNKIYGMSTVIARFFNVYGSRQPVTGPYATVVGIFEGQYEKALPLTVTGDGEQRRDFTHVSDIVKGFIALGKNKWNAEIFQFGTGMNYSINELAMMFTGDKNRIKYIPSRPGEARDTLADIHMANNLLEWYPKTRLEDYVANFKDGSLTSYQYLYLTIPRC